MRRKLAMHLVVVLSLAIGWRVNTCLIQKDRLYFALLDQGNQCSQLLKVVIWVERSLIVAPFKVIFKYIQSLEDETVKTVLFWDIL